MTWQHSCGPHQDSPWLCSGRMWAVSKALGTADKTVGLWLCKIRLIVLCEVPKGKRENKAKSVSRAWTGRIETWTGPVGPGLLGVAMPLTPLQACVCTCLFQTG